jgi:hypothetical protein
MKYISGLLLTGLLLILTHCMNNHDLEKKIKVTLDHLMSLHDSTMRQNSVAGNLIEELKKIKPRDSAKNYPGG